MKNKIADSCDIKNFHGKLMGYAYIKGPVSHTQHYECAAWHENAVSESDVVVPLILCEGYLHPHDLTLNATVPGHITDNNFQSLWCGNAIGKAYDDGKDKGKPKGIGISIPLYKALESSFQLIESKDVYHGIHVSSSHINKIEEYYQKKFDSDRDYIAEQIIEHKNFGNGGERGCEFISCCTQIGHVGNKLNHYADILKRINFLKSRYGAELRIPDWMEGVRTEIAKGEKVAVL